jgi:hypothetical protein
MNDTRVLLMIDLMGFLIDRELPLAFDNVVHSTRNRISSASPFKRLAIVPINAYYNRRLLLWTGHVAFMPCIRAPRTNLACCVDNPRPINCPQMNWGRTLK